VLGNPLETTLALHNLIFSGTLARFPDLKLMAVHGGGYLPGYSGRIDHAWGARKDSHGDLPLAADDLSAAGLSRHRGVQLSPARLHDRRVRPRSHRDGHRLSLRHGRI
jgi:hypothetical protein